MKRLEKKFPRYHQRLADVGRWFHGARFEDDPYFDINNHAHVVRLPEPAGKRELDEFVSKYVEFNQNYFTTDVYYRWVASLRKIGI